MFDYRIVVVNNPCVLKRTLERARQHISSVFFVLFFLFQGNNN